MDKRKLLDRFVKYTEFDTHSIEDSDKVPSNDVEFEFANFLKAELQQIGIKNVEIDEHCFLYAILEASEGLENKPSIAFITHLDVTSEVKSCNIKPTIEENSGRTLIKTDGTTLLGADDKAGIVEVVSAFEYVIKNNINHPRIVFVATPDEETSEGIAYIDLKKINSKYAYTIDGEAVGEIEYENFYAKTIDISINGYNIHPGSAYKVMKNAIIMSSEFLSKIPNNLKPEESKGRQGFILVDRINGDVSKVDFQLSLRSFSNEEMDKFCQLINEIQGFINEKYGENTCKYCIKDLYENMHDWIIPKNRIMIDIVKDVYNELGINPIEDPIRGGTDGAEITIWGLPAPNIGTGAMNIHSVNECIYLEDMVKVSQVIVKIVEKYASL